MSKISEILSYDKLKNFLSSFSDGRIICIACGMRVNPYEAAVSKDGICICRFCHKKLYPIPKGSAFAGGEFANYVISGYYYNDLLRELIHRYKFGDEHKISALFAELLYNRIKDIENLTDFDLITAVPISYKRDLKRGYNQSELIARIISEKTGIPYIPVIYKKTHTAAQSTLKASERAGNVFDVFIADKTKVKGKNILLADDIFTTGSTLSSCAKELSEKGAEYVACITFAAAGRRYISG